VYAVSEGRPQQLLGGTTMRLFSKKGRLKTGQQVGGRAVSARAALAGRRLPPWGPDPGACEPQGLQGSAEAVGNRATNGMAASPGASIRPLPAMQVLRLWQGREACSAWPSSTPGKAPLAERGRLGLLQHQLKLYSRGEVQQLEWLDTLLLRVGRAAGWPAV
jgi:hypothetical protein